MIHPGKRWLTPLLLLLLTLPALAQPGEAVAPGSAVAKPAPIVSNKLDNGLDVIVIEDHAIPLATISIAVRNGSFTEPDEFAGLSHLYEHMFFKSNAKIPSQERYMKKVRELGIVFNGYTTDEVVVYFFTLPAKNLRAGMEFMSDAIQSPLFLEDELVKEREVVLGEFDRNEASPEFTLRYALDSALWMPHVSRKQPLGQRHIIKTATAEKMRMIQERFYIPNNSALIVSGDVKQSEVVSLAKKFLGDWKRGADPFPTYMPPKFAPLTPKLVVREAKVPDVVVRMHFYGPSLGIDEPQIHVGQLFATIIRQQTSRLYNNLVDSGLVTGFGAFQDNARNTGDFTFYLSAPKEKATAAIAALKNEIRKMGEPGYFTEEEIAAAKEIIEARSTFERDDINRFNTGTIAQWWSLASIEYYETFPAKTRTITAAQLTDFARRYLTGRPFVLGVGAEKKTLDALNLTEDALKWN
jgi:zinc protease